MRIRHVKATRGDAAKLMNHYNPGETGGYHGLLGVHLGMRVRLTELLDKPHGLVKDAEGVVARVEVDERDQAMVDAAFAEDGDTVSDIYLRYQPLGIRLRMDKYAASPCSDVIKVEQPGLLAAVHSDSLYWLEPRETFSPFKWRDYTIHRRAFPLTHGCVSGEDVRRRRHR